MRKLLLLLLTVFFVSPLLSAQSFNYWIDSTFGNNGEKYIDFLNTSEAASNLNLYPNGDIILSGVTLTQPRELTFAKLLSSGLEDSTFGNQGLVRFNIPNVNILFIFDTEIQSDGKIVSVGQVGSNSSTSEILIIRLNQDGSLDSSFAGNGIAQFVLDPAQYSGSRARGVEVLSGDRIMISGLSVLDTSFFKEDIFLLRLNSDGSYDTNFGNSGFMTYSPDIAFNLGWSLERHTDGDFLISGGKGANANSSSLFILKVDTFGQQDPNFGISGRAVAPLSGSFQSILDHYVVHPNNFITACGLNEVSSNGAFDGKIIQFDANGNLNQNFATGGYFSITNPLQDGWIQLRDIELLDSGKILSCGYIDMNTNPLEWTMLFVRLDSNGNLDPSFDSDGLLTFPYSNGLLSDAFEMELVANGDMVIVGRNGTRSNSLFYSARVNPNVNWQTLSISNEFDEALVDIYPNPSSDFILFDFHSPVFRNPDFIIHIVDMQGRTHKSIESKNLRNILDISDLAPGTYMLSFELGNQIVRKKLIKK